jgi:hypothetical protein
MQEQRKFVFVSLISSVVSGLAVAMLLLLYLPGSSQQYGDMPAAGSQTSHQAAMLTTQPSLGDTTPRSGDAHAPATPATQPLPRSQTRAPVSQAQLRQHQAELQHLEQRLQQLENTRNAPQGAAEEAQTGAELTPEEGRAAELAWWEETQRRFEREAVDTPWATATTSLFAEDLGGLVENAGFTLVHTECRSTQCAAVLEWSSYGDAVQGFATLLHHSYQANCARGTLLPPPQPEEVEQPYHMTIIFDCSAWRQHG